MTTIRQQKTFYVLYDPIDDLYYKEVESYDKINGDVHFTVVQTVEPPYARRFMYLKHAEDVLKQLKVAFDPTNNIELAPTEFDHSDHQKVLRLEIKKAKLTFEFIDND